MCIKCVLLGALVNAGVPDKTIPSSEEEEAKSSSSQKTHQTNDNDDDNNIDKQQQEERFRTESLSVFDYTPSPLLVRGMIDHDATQYLRPTLTKFKEECNIEFRVLEVENDGSCLPHAISRCLVGHELYYDALRLDLKCELLEHKSWYQSVLNVDADDGTQIYDEEEWTTREWPRIVNAASPTYGLKPGEDRWLGPEHVLGFANLLGRPILLLNVPEVMCDRHNGHRGGLFLPLRRTREEILRQHNGNFPSPIVVGYASAVGNHYVALVRTRSAVDMMMSMISGPVNDYFKEHWSETVMEGLQVETDVMLRCQRPSSRTSMSLFDEDVDEEAHPVLMVHPKTKRSMYVIVPKPDAGDIGNTFTTTKIYPAWADHLSRGVVQLLLMNGPSARKRALKTLKLYVKNLIKAQEDVAYGKFDMMEKVKTIRLDKSAGCRWIVGVEGAQEVLEACGYKMDEKHCCLRLRRPPIAIATDDDADDAASSTPGAKKATSAVDDAACWNPDEEDELLRSEGIRIDDVWGIPLRFIASQIEAVDRVNNGTQGELTGGGDRESRLFGTMPRYSWLGVGPTAVVDARTNREKLPSWPSAVSPQSLSDTTPLWNAARMHYGAGLSNRPDDVWTFGTGTNSTEFCTERMIELQARFFTLTRGAFGKFPSVYRKLLTDPTVDIIVTCPLCNTRCRPNMSPKLLAGLPDEECETNCPNYYCPGIINMKKTYQQCLADAVADSARGALGGVWRCDAPVTESSEEVAEETGGAACSRGVCSALNVGYSRKCVACGTLNPNPPLTPLTTQQRTPRPAEERAPSEVAKKKAKRDEEKNAPLSPRSEQEEMLKLLIEVLSGTTGAAAGGVGAPGVITSPMAAFTAAAGEGGTTQQQATKISTLRQEETTTTTSQEKTRTMTTATTARVTSVTSTGSSTSYTLLDFEYLKTLDDLSSSSSSDEETVSVVDGRAETPPPPSSSEEVGVSTTTVDPLSMPPRKIGGREGKRGISCPVVLSIIPNEVGAPAVTTLQSGAAPPSSAKKPPTAATADTQATLHMTAVLSSSSRPITTSGNHNNFIHNNNAIGNREISEPLTQKERMLRAQESGLELTSLTRKAALELLKGLKKEQQEMSKEGVEN